jgi:hypothetical protein
MLELLAHLFGAVCGQNPGHTWAPGGMWLPFCQRCTGLYVGACVAAFLHVWLRPRLSGRFLEIHGSFFLLVAPFAFHWVPQGPALRTITGVLFGFAVVTFLWLPLKGKAGDKPAHFYLLMLGATLAILPVSAAMGGPLAAYVLAGLALCGALTLLALVIANLVLGAIGTARVFRRVASPRLSP